MVIATSKPKRPRRLATRSCLGPVADLEAHLPEEWWRKLFNALYVKTDGDVVENLENTRREVDFIVAAAAVQPHSHILDLCCGQGRHCLELARRGFKHVMGLDRSRYLVRLAKKRAQGEGLQVLFKEGDARNPRLPESTIDCVAIMGNSFGYFSNKQDDEKVLTAVGKILRPSGQLVLDITDGSHMHEHFEKRSWEWIDEHHFVCRERSISQDRERLISREVIVHDEMGVIADQFYAERLYTRESIAKLLEKVGFRNVRHHGHAESQSDRDQDLRHDGAAHPAQRRRPGSARPQEQGQAQALDVTVVLGDHRLPDQVKRGGAFNPEDIETTRKLKDALAELAGYSSASSTTTARWSATSGICAPTWCSISATRAGTTIPSRSCTFRRSWRCWASAIPVPAPAALAACYDKGLVRAVAQSLDVPVPLESYVRPGDQGATLPSVFPALLKPNQGDSSQGITKDAVVSNEKGLLDYLDRLRADFPKRGVLVQEFLTGAEYSVGLIGNPDQGLEGPADPGGRLLAARCRPAEDPRLRIEVAARQPLLDADQVPRGDAGRPPAAADDRQLGADVRAARLSRVRPLRFPGRRQGRDQAPGGEPQPRLVLGRQDEPDGRLPGHALLRDARPDPAGRRGASWRHRQAGGRAAGDQRPEPCRSCGVGIAGCR